METIKTRSIIIKQTNYGEGHRMLTLFCEEHGIIKAVSYGAGRMKSSKAAATQFLCYGDFELYPMHGDLSRVNSITPKETFYPIHEDIEKLSLSVYLADLTCAALDMGNPDEQVLKLLLNILYAIAYKNTPALKAKAVYELRLCGYAGFYPVLDSCIFCGSTEICGFSVSGGAVCAGCMKKDSIGMIPDVLAGLRYIMTCPDKRVLSFEASDAVIQGLSLIGEAYCKSCFEREFPSLEYFKSIANNY